jgi:hypothetical protein
MFELSMDLMLGIVMMEIIDLDEKVGKEANMAYHKVVSLKRGLLNMVGGGGNLDVAFHVGHHFITLVVARSHM